MREVKLVKDLGRFGFFILPTVFLKGGERFHGHKLEIIIDKPLAVGEIVMLAREISRALVRSVMRGAKVSVLGVKFRPQHISAMFILSFMLGHLLAHIVHTVAVYDPRYGYVVVASHTPELSEGDILFEEVKKQ